MREIGLRFIFKGRPGFCISRAAMYEFRRETSRMFQEAGFGESYRSTERDGFDNEYAIPSIDAYDETTDELHISYYFTFPLTPGRGNLWSLHSTYVPELHNFAETYNADLRFHTILL